MSSWIALAIVGQLLVAVSVFIDRYVLKHSRGIGEPIAYAFYISLLSGFVVVFLPFGIISPPSLFVLGWSLVMAAAFIVSVLFLYRALKESAASDVMPVVAACSSITSFVLAYWWLDENLPTTFVFSVALFVIGTFLISQFKFTRQSILHVVYAGVLFGLSAFIIKLIFENSTFWDGFFWTRMANVLGAVLLLLWPGNAQVILHGVTHSSHSAKWLVIGNKTLAGIAGMVTFFAISLGSVSVVNAMAGLQFAFLLALAYLFAPMFPAVLKDEVHSHGLSHKLAGVALIIVGLAALYFV